MHFGLVKANMKSKKEARINANFLYQRFMSMKCYWIIALPK